jgi:hypothetical protein
MHWTWRQNPPPKTAEGYPLREHQVRSIVNYFEEIEKGWHTREWFTDLLRGGEDPETIRYILANVNWGMRNTHRIKGSAKQEVNEYLEELDLEKYPEIVLNEDLMETLQKFEGTLDPYITDRIDSIRGVLTNLTLAERLGESRESIHHLKSQIQLMQMEIQRALDQAQDAAERAEEAEEAGEMPAASQAAEILACGGCGEEDFAWLDAEARTDVVDISANPQIAKLQHRLRHAVMSLRDGTVKGKPKYQLFDIEDEIADTHAAIEQLRRRGNPYRWNPWW